MRFIIRPSIRPSTRVSICASVCVDQACSRHVFRGSSPSWYLRCSSRPAGNAQNWAGAEGLLAGKIVSATGPKTMALQVSNRSSLSAARSDDIRRNLLTQLAVTGVRFVSAEQAAVSVRVTLSEDLRNYVWVAEIRQGGNAPAVVMVSLPRSAVLAVEPAAATMVLREVSLWSQPERILDVALISSNPARMLVLDANGVTSYRMQESRWLVEQSLPIPHSRPWPRDLRGRLVLRSYENKDHLFDAYLPGVTCRSSGRRLSGHDVLREQRSLAHRVGRVQPECVFYFFAQFLQWSTLARSRHSSRGRRLFIPRQRFPANHPRGGCWPPWMGVSICLTASPIRWWRS